MMVPKEIISVVFAEPFRPFRLHMASGKTYDIRHPEVVQLGRNHLTLFTPFLDDETEGDQLWKKISLMLVESVEPIDTSVDVKRDQE